MPSATSAPTFSVQPLPPQSCLENFLKNAPPCYPPDTTFDIEPRNDTKHASSWPIPDIIQSVQGTIRIPNYSQDPLNFKRHEHLAQATNVFEPSTEPVSTDPIAHVNAVTSPQPEICSAPILIDPDHTLPESYVSRFRELHLQYDEIFDTNFPGYNGAVGPLKAVVNMGPVLPPQRKGRLPQYSRNKLQELEAEFDRLESLDVFVRPADVNVVAEYLNPSFLVKKPSGGHRLVTAFTEVGTYAKPQPLLKTNVDSTLRQIACWKYLIATDLTKTFYQIPLDHDSMKYCGVVTPFRGVRVYNRCAMGMQGSETALEELMSAVLGHLIQQGIVAKIADDLYCGRNSPEELFTNWEKVLTSLRRCNLRLSPSKTVVARKTTSILGWTWSEGTISASKHRSLH